MEQVYSLLFTLFFDLVLLVALSHYHRRLGYRFLKFGAMALVLEMLSQTLFYTAMFFPGTSLPAACAAARHVVRAERVSAHGHRCIG